MMLQTSVPNLETNYGKFKKVYLTTTRLNTCLNIEKFVFVYFQASKISQKKTNIL